MNEERLIAYEQRRPAPVRAVAAEPERIINLPTPDYQNGMPLMQALTRRASCRDFKSAELPMTLLGSLLWAADGVNRPLSGGRTAPSPHARHEVDIYAALPAGVYRYDAATHRLILKHAVDARGQTGYQDFVGHAPLDLVYVVQTSRLIDMPAEQRKRFSAVTAGAIAQNVALYCASAGLSSVVRGWLSERILSDALSLNEDEVPILAQTIGFPAST
ncbi:MAG: SagB/ThcOx family dehydrogenase [Bordetella sp.]|uniref:SagB/ThcOx family dehydrogenase n=1 Tax=Bordetella sp. TaxID=28081 RepID=UPI003F7C775C